MSVRYDYKAALRRAGKSQVGLAAALGISKDSAFRLVNGTRDVEAGEHARAVAYIEGDQPEAQPLFEQINVYGYAAGQSDRIAFADNRIIDRIEVPVGLVRGEAFGVRIAGDSMEPRLFAGETVIVARNLRPARNGDVVVEFNDGSAIVKQYQGERDGVVFLHQYNPDQQLKIPGTQIRTMHAVIYRR